MSLNHNSPTMSSLRLRRVLAFVLISVLVSVIEAQLKLQGAAFLAFVVFGTLIPFILIMRLWPDNPETPWKIFSTINPALDRQSMRTGILVFLGITAFAPITAFYPVLWWPIVIFLVASYVAIRRKRDRTIEAKSSDTP